MNFESPFTPRKKATVRYLDADFQVLTPGNFVSCAVTGKPIGLDDLKYWSVERQEAYASATQAMQRLLEETR